MQKIYIFFIIITKKRRVMKSIKNFLELTRGYSLLMTFASCLVIFGFANFSPRFTLLNFLLLTLGVSCVQLGANLFDDLIDVKTKLKKGIELKDITFKTFLPKARLITNSTYSFSQIERILNILFSIAIGVGVCFIIFSGWKILIFMLIGGILTLFYPISSRYYCSELIIGSIFGPLVIMGGFYALTQEFSSNLFILSLAIFFTTLVLLHTHNIMDWEFDIEENKNTLAILSGNKQNAIKILIAFITIAYLIILIGVLSARLNPNTLYVFLTLPIAAKLIESINDYVIIKDVEFKPRWYYGFFENWEEIKENKVDFYMFRLYLARNFAFFFALLTAIGTII